MKETVESISQWAEETFGPCTPRKALERAITEVKELLDEWDWEDEDEVPQSKYVEEAADVCITLYRYIYLVDPDAIEKKMAINRARKWKVSNGVGQHV